MEEILDRRAAMQLSGGRPTVPGLPISERTKLKSRYLPLNRLDEADGVHGLLEQVPYPKAGDPNPKVKMGIADIASGKTTWVKTDYNIDQYIAWPFLDTDSRKLAVQVINRDQNEMDIILADPAYRCNFSGTSTMKKQKAWLDFYKDIYVMKDGSGFIVNSVRNGWENLYYYSWTANYSTADQFRLQGHVIERVDES